MKAEPIINCRSVPTRWQANGRSLPLVGLVGRHRIHIEAMLAAPLRKKTLEPCPEQGRPAEAWESEEVNALPDSPLPVFPKGSRYGDSSVVHTPMRSGVYPYLEQRYTTCFKRPPRATVSGSPEPMSWDFLAAVPGLPRPSISVDSARPAGCFVWFCMHLRMCCNPSGLQPHHQKPPDL